MFKPNRLALAAAVFCTSQVHSTPFFPMDARGLAMGNTGVASAKLAHAPNYNPSLLTQGKADDDFAFLLQGGINLADEKEIISQAEDIDEFIIPQFEGLLEENSSNNFSSAIDDMQAAADQLENQVNNIADTENDDRTPEQRAEDLRNDAQALSDSIDQVEAKLEELNSATSDLTSALNSISGDPLRTRLGVGLNLAFPGETLAAAITVKGNLVLSGRTLFSRNDQRLIEAYGLAAAEYLDAAGQVSQDIYDFADTVQTTEAEDIEGLASEASTLESSVEALANFTSDEVDTADGEINIIKDGLLSSEAEDPELDSRVEVIGVGIAEFGFSIAHKLNINDHYISVGITPKLQKIDTYHYVTEMDSEEDIDADDIQDSKESYSHLNLDVGVSFYMDSNKHFMFGLVAQDLIEKEFEIAEAPIRGSADNLTLTGNPVSLNAKYRAGISYQSKWFNAAIDYDLSKNKPVAYESATQYASIGGEVNLYDVVQLRGGLRLNVQDDSSVTSVGVGLSPFGVHLDITAMFADPDNLEKEAGIVAETGFYF